MPAPRAANQRLQRLSHTVHERAQTFDALLSLCQAEVESVSPYHHVWLYVADEELTELRMIAYHGGDPDTAWAHAPRVRIADDALAAALVHSRSPIVIEDAQVDPRTDKQIVSALGNRTIVNIPLPEGGRPVGVFGMGTFRDEGVAPPDEDLLDYLVGLANLVALAVSNLRLEAVRRERASLRQRLDAARKCAHDLHNLLNVIALNASFGEDDLSPTDQRTALQDIAQAAQQAAGLTQRLFRSECYQARRAPVHLDHCLRRLLTLLRPALPPLLHLHLDLPASLPPVMGDADQLDQVLLNLIINAGEALPAGGNLWATARHHPGAEDAGVLILSLRDDGPGIPANLRTAIFEPGCTTKARGSGLGLAVVAEVMRDHGGGVTCESGPRGTTFTLCLPAYAPRPT